MEVLVVRGVDRDDVRVMDPRGEKIPLPGEETVEPTFGLPATWIDPALRDEAELRGYLSTAQPGWGMIACRTVADFRVDDCVALDEYPTNSRLARAVLAAAWQFRVRPPQLGGQMMVGEWVRIRFDYGARQRAAWEKDRN